MRQNSPPWQTTNKPLGWGRSGLENRGLIIKGVILIGGVAERLIAPVLKTGEVSNTSVGSNPTPTANAQSAADDQRARTDGTDYGTAPAQLSFG